MTEDGLPVCPMPDDVCADCGYRCSEASMQLNAARVSNSAISERQEVERRDDYEDGMRGRIHELEVRVRELEAENAKLKRGEWFYDCEDGENSSGDWSGVLEYADFDGPMLIAGAREVERFWVARVVLTWDEDGSPDDSEIRRFATKAEALAAMNGGQVELALATQPSDRTDPVLSIPEEAPKG